jgi:hypothetical protein
VHIGCDSIIEGTGRLVPIKTKAKSVDLFLIRLFPLRPSLTLQPPSPTPSSSPPLRVSGPHHIYVQWYTRICICKKSKLKHIQLYIHIFYKSTVYGATAYVYNYKITNASAQGISLYLLFTNILAIYVVTAFRRR